MVTESKIPVPDPIAPRKSAKMVSSPVKIPPNKAAVSMSAFIFLNVPWSVYPLRHMPWSLRFSATSLGPCPETLIQVLLKSAQPRLLNIYCRLRIIRRRWCGWDRWVRLRRTWAMWCSRWVLLRAWFVPGSLLTARCRKWRWWMSPWSCGTTFGRRNRRWRPMRSWGWWACWRCRIVWWDSWHRRWFCCWLVWGIFWIPGSRWLLGRRRRFRRRCWGWGGCPWRVRLVLSLVCCLWRRCRRRVTRMRLRTVRCRWCRFDFWRRVVRSSSRWWFRPCWLIWICWWLSCLFRSPSRACHRVGW